MNHKCDDWKISFQYFFHLNILTEFSLYLHMIWLIIVWFFYQILYKWHKIESKRKEKERKNNVNTNDKWIYGLGQNKKKIAIDNVVRWWMFFFLIFHFFSFIFENSFIYRLFQLFTKNFTIFFSSLILECIVFRINEWWWMNFHFYNFMMIFVRINIRGKVILSNVLSFWFRFVITCYF